VAVVVMAVLAVADILLQARAPNLAAAGRKAGMTCSLAPDQTFNAPADTQPTSFTLDAGRACLNGRTPYEKTANGYARVITNAATSVVSTLEISQDQSRLQRRSFVLKPKDFTALRAAIGSTRTFRCSAADPPDVTAEHQTRLTAIRAAAAPYLGGNPTSQITWRCAPAN
jgi:hypothetical protein